MEIVSNSDGSEKSESLSIIADDVGDKEIEQNFRLLLRQKRYGKYIDANIVAHLEYFNNTLNQQHKNDPTHENPFDNIDAYPALKYQASEAEILESIEESATEEESDLIDKQEISTNFPSI